MLKFSKNNIRVGIDISDASVEILHLNGNDSVDAYGRAILEPGIVEDGLILKKEKLAVVLAQLLKNLKPHSLDPFSSRIEAVFSIPESKTFLHLFTVRKGLTHDALRTEILQQSMAVIPVEAEKLYVDIMPLGIGTDKEELVLYAAGFKEVIDRYRDVMKQAHLEPSMCDIESLSVARALINRGIGSTMIIDMGARTSTASIFDDQGVFNISVTLPTGGNDITDAISDSLGQSATEAEKTKQTYGFRTDKKENVIFPILERYFQDVVTELQHAIEFYETRRRKKINIIMLTGGTALLPKLDNYLGTLLERKVVLANPLKPIINATVFGNDVHPLFFSNVIGLALRGAANSEEGLNLLHDIIVKEKVMRRHRISPSAKIAILMHTIQRPVFALTFFLLSIVLLGIVATQYLLSPFFSSREQEEKKNVEIPSSTMPTTTPTLSTTTIVQPTDKPAIVKTITVLATPTGWLNVRQGPGTNYPILQKIYPKATYTLLDIQEEWVHIRINEDTVGWVTSRYIMINK